MDEFLQELKTAIESDMNATVDNMNDGSLEIEFTDSDGQTHNFKVEVTKVS